METNQKDIWFPAKRYGWGWGLPVRWQGWVVLAVWIALLAAGTPLASNHGIFFSAFVVVMIALLSLICLLKGETPRWRWGDKNR